MNPDGTQQRRLTVGVHDASPEWSPDKTHIAFASDRVGEQEVWIMDADGTNRVRVTRTSPGQAFSPSWSPDGTQIAFVRSGRVSGVWVANADGSGATALTNGRFDGDPAWSPDGKAIAFVRYPSGQPGQIYLMRPNGNGVHRLMSSRPGGWWGGDSGPSWSPDSLRVAFTRDISATNPGEGGYVPPVLDVVDVTGRNLHRLIKGRAWDDSAPDWSPDGRRVVFIRGTSTADDVFVTGSDGRNVRRLTRDPRIDSAPDW